MAERRWCKYVGPRQTGGPRVLCGLSAQPDTDFCSECAGLEVDAAVDLMMREVEKTHVRGAVEAVAMLAGAVHIDGIQLRAVANLGPEVHAMRAHPFAVGPWCWVFAGVRALPEPVPCRGFQGLWELPEDVESAVLAQLARAA